MDEGIAQADPEGTDWTEEQWAVERDAFVAEDGAERERGHDRYPDHDHDPPGGPSIGMLGTVFGEIGKVVFDSDPSTGVSGVLDRIVDLGLQVVPSADLLSVTLRRAPGAGYSTPAQSDALAVALDHLQYEYDEGPCVTALERGGLGSAGSDDLARDTTWTRFGPAAAGLGARSLFAVGLFPVGDDHGPLRGALNFYRRDVGGLTEADRDLVLLLAAHVSSALAYVSVTETAELREAQLRHAIESRDVIGQAKGILMERRGCTAAEAFETMRRASQDLNVKLRTVAATIAERRAEL